MTAFSAQERAALITDLAGYRTLHAEYRAEAHRFATLACDWCRNGRSPTAAGNRYFIARMKAVAIKGALSGLKAATDTLVTIRELEEDLTP